MQSTAPDPLTVALISAGSAVIGSLLTVFFAPRMHHYFWKRQQLAERRLAIADEMNNLTSALLADVTEGLRTEETFMPTVDFFKSWNVVDRKCRIFFSQETQSVYKAMEVMMTRDTGIQRRNVDSFYQRQLEALTAIYQEVGLLGPSPFVQTTTWVREQLVRLRPAKK